MIVDLILDRRANDADIAKGFTYARWPNGKLVPLAYDAGKFYRNVFQYGEIGFDITRAMDSGTEADVKKALKDYIVKQDYNMAICDYIDSRDWLKSD